MTDQDRAAARRDIADALLNALERRHEVLDAIVESADRQSAVDAITELLGTSRIGSEAVMGMSFDRLTKDSRRRIAKELDDMNSQLSFTLKERPASSDESLQLRPFSHESDRDIFATRTEEIGSAGDGSRSADNASSSPPILSASTASPRAASCTTSSIATEKETLRV